MNQLEINLRKWAGACRWLVPYLALGLVLTAAACTSATQRSTSPNPSASQTSTSPVSSSADPAIGPVDASVTIVEYGDFG